MHFLHPAHGTPKDLCQAMCWPDSVSWKLWQQQQLAEAIQTMSAPAVRHKAEKPLKSFMQAVVDSQTNGVQSDPKQATGSERRRR